MWKEKLKEDDVMNAIVEKVRKCEIGLRILARILEGTETDIDEDKLVDIMKAALYIALTYAYATGFKRGYEAAKSE